MSSHADDATANSSDSRPTPKQRKISHRSLFMPSTLAHRAVLAAQRLARAPHGDEGDHADGEDVRADADGREDVEQRLRDVVVVLAMQVHRHLEEGHAEARE